MGDAIRTVVLARAGAACDRVVEGLAEAGAELVATVDPSQHTPDALEALSPSVLVVVLDPAVEDALEPFEPAFAVPGRTVVFEEAVLVLERTGWDAARWVRHLAAKLRGVRDVLPPSADSDAPVDEAPLALEFEAHTEAASFVAPDVPATPDIEAPSVPESTSDAATHLVFDPVAAEFDTSPGVQASAVKFSFDFELADYDETGYTPPAAPPGEVRDLNGNLAAESDASTLSLESPAAEGVAADAGIDVPVEHAADPLVESISGPMTLLDGDALPSFRAAAPVDEHAPMAATPAKTLQRDLSDLESRISGLSLTDTDSYGHGPVKGVVLIEGGLGGPDAVRQLLGALPEGFPRPVLVRLQLDGGRYDRLVRQMERATAMPVQLAEAGMTVSPGEVYFLPPDLLPSTAGGALRFAEAGDITALADAVPADDSALLFLSGADPALVDVAMGPAWQGALIGGQSEDGCYDPAAARAVAQRGGPSGSPTDIAGWLVARWMPGERNFDSGGLSL
ncbi:MAG: chemotaxis protein CheB [Luteimonas sp.]